MSLLRQVMGPSPNVNDTLVTLQFAKFNGMNYHVWSDNMKATLQAKSLWGVVSGRKLHPPVLPSEYSELVAESSSTMEPPSIFVKKQGRELFNILQSQEYKAWDLAKEKLEHWLNKSDTAMGLIHNTIKYMQRESIVSINTSKQMWKQSKKDYIKLQSGTNSHFYYQQLYTHKWDGNSSMSDHVSFYLNICR